MRLPGFKNALIENRNRRLRSAAGYTLPEASAFGATTALDDVALDISLKLGREGKIEEIEPVIDEVRRRRGLIEGSPVFKAAQRKVRREIGF